MFNGYFVKALQDEFDRVFGYDPTTPIITAAESKDIFNFGVMYLMGPMHDSKPKP